MSPRISIVLPTYNGSRYLHESIDSCLAQTYEDFELIVVDDASTDETGEIVQSYRDARMRWIRHEINRKLPAALNTGFAASSGSFLTWTSDDNRYHPNALETMVAAFEESPDSGLVYAGFRLIDEFGDVIRLTEAEPPELLSRKPVVGPCFLYRREVYEQIGGYNEHCFKTEDYEYWLRIAAEFWIRALPEILYDYRVHPDSLTNKDSLRERARAYCHLQSRVFGSDPRRFRRHLGELYMSRAFEDYLAKRYDTVPGNVIRGLLYDRSFLGNRGVFSILCRSVLRRIA